MTSQQNVSTSVGSAEHGANAPRRSQRGLDWFAFFMAGIQTGWGPFVAAYLTSVAWDAIRYRFDPN